MRAEVQRSRRGIALRIQILLVVVVAAFGIALARSAAANAALSGQTDVMFVFDTSGSMGSELTEAKSEMLKVMETIGATLPDVQYGVAEVRDFSPSVYTYEEAEPGVYPWKLDQSITADRTAVTKAIEPLEANGGGDGPESYGRALWETDTNPTVGWRPSARHVIILVADNVPHDADLNEGVEESKWIEPSPFDTGEELGGTWEIPGTQWTSTTSTDFQTVVKELGTDEKPLEDVDFSGSAGYLPYWQYWAGLSGGQALGAEAFSGELAAKLSAQITTGATIATCPAGESTNAANVCVRSTASQVICNLVLATATDTCTATVGDSDPSPTPTNPTGTVSFSSAAGGVFSAGNTCSLTPAPGTTSSCSVQFVPPTTGSTLPAITASYGGDVSHAGSSAQTHYAPLSDLAKDVDWSEVGTIKPDGSVEIPFDCGFPCEVEGELSSGPDLASLASLSGGPATLGATLAASKGKHHKAKKKKAKKPAVLGKGKLKLSTAGKGILVIKLSSKAKKALKKAGSKGARVTLKVTIKTLTGALVGTKTEHVKLRPQKPKKKRHGKGKRHR